MECGEWPAVSLSCIFWQLHPQQGGQRGSLPWGLSCLSLGRLRALVVGRQQLLLPCAGGANTAAAGGSSLDKGLLRPPAARGPSGHPRPLPASREAGGEPAGTPLSSDRKCRRGKDLGHLPPDGTAHWGTPSCPSPGWPSANAPLGRRASRPPVGMQGRRPRGGWGGGTTNPSAPGIQLPPTQGGSLGPLQGRGAAEGRASGAPAAFQLWPGGRRLSPGSSSPGRSQGTSRGALPLEGF